jgi:aryl-alcohol dehydrogenase-like predicted oxidoreductase
MTIDYRPLGRTGVLVSPLCLGAMNFGGPTDEAESERILETALDRGINFVDTANVYNLGESERIVGNVLKRNGRRETVVLATKCGIPMGPAPHQRGHSRVHIIRACEDSLRRLQTDYIDLYQLHRPSHTVPQDETLRAFDDLVHAGKVRHVGCSTHPAWMVMEALATADRLQLTPYISEQPPYNLLDRRIENELVPLCERYGLALLAWSPLAGGILAGRYASATDIPAGSRAASRDAFRARLNPRAIEIGNTVVEMAADRGVTASQLALTWVKDQPGITAPIFGPRTLAHLEEALPVLELQFPESDRVAFDSLVHPGNAVADFHNTNAWMRATIE